MTGPRSRTKRSVGESRTAYPNALADNVCLRRRVGFLRCIAELYIGVRAENENQKTHTGCSDLSQVV